MALIPKNYQRDNPSELKKSAMESDNTVAKAIDDKISAADSNPAKQSLEDGRSKEYEDRARVNMDPQPDVSTNVERDFEPEQISRRENDDENPDSSVY